MEWPITAENWKAWVAVGSTLTVFAGFLSSRRIPTDLLFVGGLLTITLAGVITPEEALAGFASPAILAIGALLICSAGLRSTGVLDWLGHQILGSVKSDTQARRRLAVVLVAISAFVLNTAVVAMFMPVVLDWCRKRGVSPSRLLMPVSYLAILGGVCTLVGTSTTLVVNAKLKTEYDRRLADVATLVAADGTDPEVVARAQRFAEQVQPMPLFEIGRVGIWCALLGTLVLVAGASVLLPDRREFVERLGDQRREYLVEMRVEPLCRLVGKSVEEAGLRHLPGLFLIEINRPAEVITPVSPTDIIQSGDRLVFTGVVSTIVDLEKIPGLVPAGGISAELSPEDRARRHLTEVVLSPSSPVIGSTVRDASFRRRYGAAILAVHRNGVRISNKIGDIVLETGDTLLLQTRGQFVSTYRNSRDFYLVSAVEGSSPRRHERAWLAGALGLILILWLVASSYLPRTGAWSGLASPAVAAMTIAALMIIFRCLPISEARGAIDLQLLLTIAGALGLAQGIDKSGADDYFAATLVQWVGPHPWTLLVVIYLMAMVFTELISNTAVAATLIPLATSTAWAAGLNPRPFIMAIALAASLSFITPIGYQTNLMVMSPGGYRPIDYLRAGLPVAMTVATTALLLIPHVWPF